MPADVATGCTLLDGSASLETLRVRRQALRIAFATAGGMTMLVANGSATPFLAPLFAAQFLLASRSLMKGSAALGMAILIIGVGQGLDLVTSALGARPALFALALWHIYLVCFLAQATGRGGQAPFLVLVIAVIVPLMNMLHRDLGESMSVLLAVAVLGGFLLAWTAHALFPDTGGTMPAPSVSRTLPASALHRAIANASILLVAVILCLVDSRFSAAIVIPVTVASILGQLELAASRRAAFGLVVVNVLGGTVASLVFTAVDIRPTMAGLFLATFFAVWLFANAAVTDPKFGKAYAGALTIFLILLGLGISPLPATTPESFTSRITYVSAAALFTLWASLLLWPKEEHESEKPSKVTKKITTSC
jgi:hypothetical protein